MQTKHLVLLVLLLLSIAAVLAAFTAAAPLPQTSGTQSSAAASSEASSTSAASSTHASAASAASSKTTLTATTTKKASIQATKSASATAPAPQDSIAKRIENPYSFPASSFTVVNEAARNAVVNIMCLPRSGGLSPISGSGVIIDPRGIILTNAHVAQYVLLSESPDVDLRCYVRTGSPAAIHWTPSVLFMPYAWVAQHASELNQAHPTGTGEHDYALLFVSGSADGAPLPAQFPYLTPDTREGIGFAGDSVLAASYPAEFVGNAARSDLYAAASVTTIGQLLTFSTSSIDAISVGGVIEAQSGSSGGAVVNAWQHLIGIITTTSSGQTTAERDLRAVTLSYINRDLKAQSGLDLGGVFAANPVDLTAQFTRDQVPKLLSLLLPQISR